MKLCKNCGKEFNNWVKINGKQRSLCNRRFCLDCSPFGSRNTRPDLSKPKCVRNSVKYSSLPEDVKDKRRAAMFWRSVLLKERALSIKGGSCEICGYSKSSRSLTFHHKDPTLKSFPLDKCNIATRKWEDVLKEIDKCQLLCFNCHMEIEDKNLDLKYLKYKDLYIK